AYNGLVSMWNAVHPGFWEFVPTIAWECTREGIDDVRYMEFLEDLLERKPDESIVSSFRGLVDIVDPDINNFQHIDPVTDVIVGKDASTWKSRDLDLMRRFLQQSCAQLTKKQSRQIKKKSVALKDIKVNFEKGKVQEIKTREVEFYSDRYICQAPVVSRDSIKIDGIMEDTWNQGHRIDDFVKLVYAAGDIPVPAENKTVVQCLRDSDNLYLFFNCFTKDITKIRATISAEKKDIKEMWRDDGIEIFIDPGCKYFTYYQIMVNANGALTDMKVDIGEEKKDDIEWNSNAEVKTSKLKDRWTAEIRIPIENFGAQEVWGINFCRNDSQEKGTHTLWSPTVKPSLGNKGFGVPEKFGKLILGKNIDAFRLIKNVKGELAFQPLGIESKVILEIDKKLTGKKLDITILNEKNQKIMENKFPVKSEKLEVPFLIFQSNEDPVY
ncbi:MAG: sugar-binding protein, partial [Candidatus Ratteibacteria bacterium]